MTKTTGLGWLGITVLLLGACGGSAGSAGPAGDAGPPGPTGATGPAASVGEGGAGGAGGASSFSIIEPRVGLTGRQVDVTVSVESASLDASATLDFGDAKVAVSAVQVVSPTTLYAHLTIDPAATLGAHDVTVTDGATVLKGTGAFTVSPPITVTVTGAPKQGSVISADIHSIDPDNFFNANASNFTVNATGDLLSLGNSNITPNDVTALLLVPPAAPAGNVQLTVQNDPSDTLSWVSQANAITVTTQSPTALTLPFTATATSIAAAGDSVYEAATSPGIGILNYTVDVTDPNSVFLPEGIIFPASGQTADVVGLLAPVQGLFGASPPPYHLIASIPNTAAAAMPTTLVLFDQSLGGGSGYAYNISVTNTAVTAVTTETTSAHATPATAQALTLPAIVNGKIAAASGEIDAYKVTLPANAVFEFSLEGTAGAYAGVPADQAGLVLSSASEAGGNDTTAASGSGAFVNTEIFTQAAAPTTTTMYFVVAGDPNTGATNPGNYTFSVRIVP